MGSPAKVKYGALGGSRVALLAAAKGLGQGLAHLLRENSLNRHLRLRHSRDPSTRPWSRSSRGLAQDDKRTRASLLPRWRERARALFAGDLAISTLCPCRIDFNVLAIRAPADSSQSAICSPAWTGREVFGRTHESRQRAIAGHAKNWETIGNRSCRPASAFRRKD